MSLPFTVVTFTDADGDEFPIRVEGDWAAVSNRGLAEAAYKRAARQRLRQMEQAGEARPTLPLRAVSRIETL